MRTVYIGIDPGMHGAVALRCEKEVTLFDIMTVKSKTISGNNVKEMSDIDIMGVVSLVNQIRQIAGAAKIVAVCEYSAGMAYTANRFEAAHHDSPKSAWKTGYNFGVIRAIFHANGIPFRATPRPGDWKRFMRLTDSTLTYNDKKEKARQMAIEMFPDAAWQLKRKKDSDRAEALLLTVWAERKGL